MAYKPSKTKNYPKSKTIRGKKYSLSIAWDSLSAANAMKRDYIKHGASATVVKMKKKETKTGNVYGVYFRQKK